MKEQQKIEHLAMENMMLRAFTSSNKIKLLWKILPKLPFCNIVTKVTENHTSFIYNNIFEDFPRRLYQ